MSISNECDLKRGHASKSIFPVKVFQYLASLELTASLTPSFTSNVQNGSVSAVLGEGGFVLSSGYDEQLFLREEKLSL